MKKILVFIGGYLPGYKYGGALRSLVNLVNLLGDEFEFYIVCADRDLGNTTAYKNIKLNEWNQVGKAKVWYLPFGKFSFNAIYKLTRNCDVIYSCGFFEPYCYKTLILQKLGVLKHTRIVVASMGVFSPGALAIKKRKKSVFIMLCKLLKLTQHVVWSVSSNVERREVECQIGKNAVCIVAQDISDVKIKIPPKTDSNELQVVFLSRISPKKNLIAAIKALMHLNIKVNFSIYGPKEDLNYWKKCLVFLSQLPSNIKWKYNGEVFHDDVSSVFARNDLFLFPTLGENHGHVVIEALAAGCVPVISDLTPWQCIAETDSGYVLSLSENMANFAAAISEFAMKPLEERQKMSVNARSLAKKVITEAKKCIGYKKIFNL